MPLKVSLTLDYREDVEEVLRREHPDMVDYRILSQSLDARGANRGRAPQALYTIEVLRAGERFHSHLENFPHLGPLKEKPIIIGAGPAGLFCALRLSDYGVPCVLFERGARAHERMKHIAAFWRYGRFDPENNVCYGEGGAGLFSDGKLITRIKSPYVGYVMNRMVDFGAPEEVAYLSNPHLGSNKIRALINKMSDELTAKGSEIHYNARVDELLFDEQGSATGVRLGDGREFHSSHIILATGHSAKEVYYELEKKNVAMRPKDFAVGVRIEHPRMLIDTLQYGEFAKDPALGASRYRLSYENRETHKGTYSFCMCPGGYVLSSGTEADGIVVNGMSNYARNSHWSNAALVVSVKAGVDFDRHKLTAGLEFQHAIEKRAYEASCASATGKELPFQTLSDFLAGSLGSGALPKTSTPSGLVRTDLRAILPKFVSDHLAKSLQEFDRRLKGFVSKEAILMAPETRTSAPITVLRDRETLESTSHQGLYPCGEGAGHAGGITSAAVDGVKVAMSILAREKAYNP